MDAQDFSKLAREISFEDRIRYARLSREQVYALSAKEKLRYFFSLQVTHTKLNYVEKMVKRRLGDFKEERIIILIGPTGAGKASFSEYFLGAEFRSSDTGKIPFIMIKAPALGPRTISWSGVYRRVLVGGHEPLIDIKRASYIRDGRLKTVQSSSKGALDSLREAVISMLRNRGTLLLAFDEVLHFLRIGDPDTVMDAFKSLADAASCQLLLIGGYDLLSLVASYGQVARRGGLVYFDRYHAEMVDNNGNVIKNKEDIDNFGNGIRKLQARWPLDYCPDFYAAREILLDATLGIFGLLKEFMINALELQLKNGGRWEKSFVKRSLKDAIAINAIRKEVEAGEKKLAEMGYGKVALPDGMIDTMINLMTP